MRPFIFVIMPVLEGAFTLDPAIRSVVVQQAGWGLSEHKASPTTHQFAALRCWRFSRSSSNRFFMALRSALLSLLSSDAESLAAPAGEGIAVAVGFSESMRFMAGCKPLCGGSMATHLSPDAFAFASDWPCSTSPAWFSVLAARSFAESSVVAAAGVASFSARCRLAFLSAFSARFMAAAFFSRLGKTPSASRMT